MSRIRARTIDETPEQRKRRLAAKNVNFTASFFVRGLILAGVGYLAWQQYQMTGAVHQGYAGGLLLMAADFGRVIMKAMDPETR